MTLKILAIETSTEFCSVALDLDGITTNNEVAAGQRHSELLLSMIQTLLADAELSLQQIDGIAFGAGPGSFTGLRIACGVAQGLAFAADLPVVAISTMEALAEKIGQPKVIVALDARMGEIYHAAYRQTNQHDWKMICPPSLCLPQQAPSVPDSDWHGCGSGFDTYDEVLSNRYRDDIQRIHYGLHPHAAQIAHLALPQFRAHAGIDPAKATPVYIRNKVALKENER